MSKDFVMIPVRQGSERLKRKNYLKINNKTILEITIEKALKIFENENIFVNTDDPELLKVSQNYGIKFYLRDNALGSSDATSDQVVLDFFKKFQPDVLLWLNTVSPLQKEEDIKKFYEEFKNSNYNSGVTVNTHHAHALIENKPINFEVKSGFARTQDLKSIEILNYACMAWKKEALNNLYDGTLFPEKFFKYESSKLSALFIKNDKDFELVRTIMNKEKI